MFDLTDKTALVTGASGGIGEAIARALHAQGATVALSGTRVEVLEALFERTRAIRREIVEAHQAGTFDAREPEKAGIAAPAPETADRPEG